MNILFNRVAFEPILINVEIENDGHITNQVMNAPEIFLRREITSLIQQAAQSDYPARVKFSRKEPIYDEYKKEWREIECFTEFTNKRYTRSSNDKTE